MSKRSFMMLGIGLAPVAAVGLFLGGFYIWRIVNNKISDTTMSVLENADTFELLSLQAMSPSHDSLNPGENFHQFPVLGKIENVSIEKRKRLLSELNTGVNSNAEQIKCFWPRHGIRALRGTQRVELVICFQCGIIEMHDEQNRRRQLSTAPTPSDTFNQFLRENGVPLSKE